MRKRKSDTAAIADMPTTGQSDNVSVRVRKIDNGYVKTVDRYGDGQYNCTETYHEQKPGMNVGADEQTDGRNSMQKAKEYMNRG